MSAPPTILIVDDHPVEVELVEEAFRHYEVPVQLQICKTGEEALGYLTDCAKCADGMPDLVLLDLTLPDMSGLEVLRMIRSNPFLHDLHVVVLSGSERPNDLEVSEGLSASFMVKPTDIAEYLVLVRSFDQRLHQAEGVGPPPTEANTPS